MNGREDTQKSQKQMQVTVLPVTKLLKKSFNLF